MIRVPAGVRPTEGRVREALLSIWGPRLAAARLLELFAGSGAVALEALGRGVLEAVAIEADETVAEALLANVRRLDAGGLSLRRARLPDELTRLAREQVAPFDLVFADPPYRFDAYRSLLNAVEPLLAADGKLAVEHSRRVELPVECGGLVRVDRRRYGESALSFYRRPAVFPPG